MDDFNHCKFKLVSDWLYTHIKKHILYRKTTKYCNVANWAWIMQSFNVLNCQ